MSNTQTFLLGILTGLFILGMFVGITLSSFYYKGYKQGRIDAISETNIKYHLTKQPDGTIIWEKIDKENNQE